MQMRFYKAVLNELERLSHWEDAIISPLTLLEAAVQMNDILYYLEYVEDDVVRASLSNDIHKAKAAFEREGSPACIRVDLLSICDRLRSQIQPKIRIDCIINRAVHWRPCKKLIEAFMDESVLDVSIIPTPYIASYKDDYGAVLQQRVAGDGFTFIDFNEYNIEKSMPDIVFINQPYDNLKTREFRFFRLDGLIGHIVYLEYAHPSGLGINAAFSEGAFFAEQIIVPSPIHATAFLHTHKTRGHMLCVGSPDADIALEGCGHATGESVLWNIIAANNLQTYPGAIRQIDLLEAMLIRFPDIANRVRFHPFFMDYLYSRICGERILKMRTKYKNLIIDDSPDFYAALEKSSAFITGPGSATILSALAYGLPILITHNTFYHDHVIDMLLLDALYTGDTEEDFKEFYKMLIDKRDSKRDRRLWAGRQYLTVTDGTASQKITREMVRHYESREGIAGAR